MGMEKILIVGDIHGDWGKMNALMQQKQPDIAIQCGDFGHWHCEACGEYEGTTWQALDYPGHGGRWWTWMK